LSTSRLLIRKGYHVVNVARHFPGDKDILYTSIWAGAHYRPIPDTDALTRRVADFARATYPAFKEIAETDVSSGVKMLDGYEYLDDPSGDYDAHKWGRYAEIDGFQVIEESQLPTGTKFGTKYKTYCVNPPVYLAWLERELVLGGVQFIRRDLTCIAEVFPLIKDPDVQLVVNCSGIGFSDPDVFPTRGPSTCGELC
jgi:D-amino-acid oxidase